MLAEIIAAILLVSGSAIALAAAIGVARLPDAFLRMHAATKAGMVAAGLVLLGAGFAFGGVEAWARVAAILLFLLITLPLASHALGRAAYVGGAPLWSGTMTDQLEGVLARGAFDSDPARRAPDEGEAPAAPRLLVALAGGEAAAPALRQGLQALAPSAAEATLLSLICVPSLGPRDGPAPPARLAAARAAAAALTEAMAEECRRLGLPCRTRHEEGDAARLLRAAAARHDLLLAVRGAWFDHGQSTPPGRHTAALPGGAKLLVGAGIAGPFPARVLALQDGRPATRAALARFLALGIAPDAPILVLPLDLPGAAEAAEAARALAATHGRAVAVHPTPLDPDHPPGGDAAPGPADLVIAAQEAALCTAARAMQAAGSAVLLA